jgi:hypothetical protein
VSRRHFVTVLEQVPDHRPARLAGRSGHTDLLCQRSPFASVTTYSAASRLSRFLDTAKRTRFLVD